MKKNGEYDPPRLGSLKKICRIMKATMLFLMLTVCHSFGMVHAQEVRLDIDLEKANFAEFMEQVMLYMPACYVPLSVRNGLKVGG